MVSRMRFRRFYFSSVIEAWGGRRRSFNIDVRVWLKQIKREVLTARKGQRPAAWMDWLELRNTYLGWSGYGVIACERREIG